MNETRPSKKQRELLNFIEAFIAQHGYGPSYREIMRGIGYKSVSTVAIHIDNLIAKGHLRKRTRSARSLEVVKREYDTPPASVNTQEQWLVEKINEKFHEAEHALDDIETQTLDELYVLVGALHVLGFKKTAAHAKARLVALKQNEVTPATQG
jgi:SOS-response transcriptional repressor LexA